MALEQDRQHGDKGIVSGDLIAEGQIEEDVVEIEVEEKVVEVVEEIGERGTSEI